MLTEQKVILAAIVFMVLFMIVAYGTIGYVIGHFISKFW